MKTLKLKIGGRTKRVRVVNMRNKIVISPFFLACSHYKTGSNCDIGVNLSDDRVCCECGSYDGGKILALNWGDGEANFLIYPFKMQYSRTQIEAIINNE